MSNTEIEVLIRKKSTWECLPQHAKQILGNSRKEYDAAILSFSLKNQLRYRGNLIKQVFKEEQKYYEKLLQFGREQLMLFPYHLSDVIIRGLKVSPFHYYVAMLDYILGQERSYDSLPNFTAADCLRLLGVGRNQYIDLINQCKASKRLFAWTVNRKNLLPTRPRSIQIEPWWVVSVGFISVEDVKDCTPEEKNLIDRLIDTGPKAAGELQKDLLQNLYSLGLVYLEVPVQKDEYFSVPPLEGFVMNRVLGDYMETLLYKIFVSIDEKTSVQELASLLNLDASDVQMAVSIYCRLGFAKKKGYEVLPFSLHQSWKTNQQSAYAGTFESDESILDELNSMLSDWPAPTRSITMDSMGGSVEDSLSDGKRVAFLFDSTLTAYLMMGNLSSGLKMHAVTMFEVGKLTQESIETFLEELEKIHCEDGEGEAKRYFDHAYSLRETIKFFLNESKLGREEQEDKVRIDLVHYGSLQSLDSSAALRLLKKNYYMLFSMAPLSCNASLLRITEPIHFGPPSPDFYSPWFKLFLYAKTGLGPPSLLLPKGTRLRKLPDFLLDFEVLSVTSWGQNPGQIPVQTAMVVLTEALIHSAIFVQGYSQEARAIESYIPLPAMKNENVSEGTRQILDRVNSIFNLEMLCGYVTLVRLKSGLKQPVLQSVEEETPGNRKSAISGISGVLELDTPGTTGSGGASDSPDLGKDNQIVPSQETTTGSEPAAEAFDKIELEQVCTSTDISSVDNGELLQIDETYRISCDRNVMSTSRDSILDNAAEDGGVDGDSWVLFGADFGIPLFDQDLNKTVCKRLKEQDLLSANRSKEVEEQLLRIQEELSAFIVNIRGPNRRHPQMQDSSQLNIPTETVAFLNGKLHIPYVSH